jgi:mannose-1-phosphate guanylyltransferase
MTPGTVFISHRAEYGKLVRELEKAIEKIDAISEEVAMSNLFGIAKASIKWEDIGRWQSARSART